MLSAIVKLIKALNSNSRPSEIAVATSVGIMLGFMPKNNLLWYILLVFFMFVRMNKSAYIIMIAISSLFAPLLDNYFHQIGYFILTYPKFETFFSTLIDIPFVGFTKINNTIVCGSLFAGIVLFLPLYVLFLLFIKLWRSKIAPSLNNSKLAKALYRLPFVSKIATKISEME